MYRRTNDGCMQLPFREKAEIADTRRRSRWENTLALFPIYTGGLPRKYLVLDNSSVLRRTRRASDTSSLCSCTSATSSVQLYISYERRFLQIRSMVQTHTSVLCNMYMDTVHEACVGIPQPQAMIVVQQIRASDTSICVPAL